MRKPEDAILAKWNQYKTRTHTGIAKADTYDSGGKIDHFWNLHFLM